MWQVLWPSLGGKSIKSTTHCGCYHNTVRCGALKSILPSPYLGDKSRKSTTYLVVIVPPYIKYIYLMWLI